ncbi:hypothetical protein ESA2_CDS12 [Staphylococcus phage ESa2]|nr:hypothetical protein ESA2_CDS12 [Staphylococcus phage ESa2]
MQSSSIYSNIIGVRDSNTPQKNFLKKLKKSVDTLQDTCYY